MELLSLTLELNADQRLAISSSFNLEGPELAIFCDNRIVELSSDESLGIENSVNGVSGDLILGSITNKSFSFSESDV
jgi:hypothetical protein